MSDSTPSGGCPVDHSAMNKAQSSEGTTSPYPSQNYLNLYHGFTDHSVEDDPSVAYLNQENAAEEDKNDFIAVGGTHMIVETNAHGSAVIPFRKSDVPGFIEITSVSHITPCMAYFAHALDQYGEDPRLQKRIGDYYENLAKITDD
ncbi:MAG: hypothetical protein AAF570_01515, partial [Bacteroidota bacterium]